MDGQRTTITDPSSGQEKMFTFDHSYFVNTNQETVYNDLAIPLMEKAFDGYNGTMFAYGQTGSGKSFSMMGYGANQGIIPRMNRAIFSKIRSLSQNRFLVTVSYLEIYNEVVRDLLNPTDKDLKIRENPKIGIYVEGLAEMVVKTPEEVERYIDQGTKARSVGATNMNEHSSRSHSVFTVRIEQRPENATANSKATVSKLNLVDLAGSERADRTGATGDRLKEGAAINKSLSALGNVISTLADPEKRKGHVPYRDSKLTRILQESLGGNTITIMLCALSPADDSYEETKSTLEYANRAKNIQNVARKNEDENARVIRELREEIDKLRQQLGTGGATATGAQMSKEDEEKLSQMDDMIKDLEYAKQQAWDEKERISKMFEVERNRNLATRGLLDAMETIKQENARLKEKLDGMRMEKEDQIQLYKESKARVDDLMAQLQGDMKKYQELKQSGQSDTEEAKVLAGRIQGLRATVQDEAQRMKKLKARIQEITDQQKQEKEDGQSGIGPGREMTGDKGKQFLESESKRIQEENKAILDKERKEMEEKLAEEKRRVQAEAEKRYAEKAQSITVGEFVALETKKLEAEAEKKLLESRVQLLEKQIENSEKDKIKLHEQMQLELEKQQLQLFQIFRRYREYFETERQDNIQKFQGLLQDAIQDAMHYASENTQLQREVDRLKKLAGGK
eukprot:TRINITY_DN9166_c0_g1_i5.p1 TRINITY_DN9166_c0_g1~~TRINITY_DN9166_c0_g1_i5.p1  ORF type:complete len:682 (+),score=200.92 TRINITY_DN9166_c0_g1_i5:343-2388(+)